MALPNPNLARVGDRSPLAKARSSEIWPWTVTWMARICAWIS